MSETGGVFHVKQQEGKGVGVGSFMLEKMGVVERVWSRGFVMRGLLVLELDE